VAVAGRWWAAGIGGLGLGAVVAIAVATPVGDVGPATAVRAGSPEVPCTAPAETIRLTGRPETLRAGWLPAGFALANGREEGPSGPWSPRYGAGAGQEIWLSRSFAVGRLAAEADDGPAPTTIHGQPATVSVTGARTVVSWLEQPGVAVVVSAAGIDRDTTLRVAEATSYQRAALAAGMAWSPCRPTLPQGALSREHVLSRTIGTRPEAKLVRLAQFEQAHPGLLRCDDTPCDPGLVGWAVLTHDLNPRMGSPMSPTPTGPGWMLGVVDATTGEGRGGSSSGLGLQPPAWAALDDLAP